MRIQARWLLLALPTIIVGIILIVLLNWHLPTRVKVTLKTDRLNFHVGGADKTTILDSVGVKSLIIEKFSRLELRPETLSWNSDATSVNRPSPNARPRPNALVVKQQPMVITRLPEREQANVTLIPKASDPKFLLSMDAVRAQPATEIVLENAGDPEDLILKVSAQQLSGNITVAAPVRITLDQCEVRGLEKPLPASPLQDLLAQLQRDSAIKFDGEPEGMILTLTVPQEQATALFPRGRIPVTAVKLERLDGDNGQVLSSLLPNSSAELTYPDYPDKGDKITISPPDFLTLGTLQDFYIENLTYSPGEKGLSLTLQGVATNVSSGSATYRKDYRLTVYDALWRNHKLVALFAALVWVAGTTAAFYKFFRGNEK